jgi:hypothetical protein
MFLFIIGIFRGGFFFTKEKNIKKEAGAVWRGAFSFLPYPPFTRLRLGKWLRKLM